MTTALAARTFTLAPGGDGVLRSYDPNGAFFTEFFETSAVAPVVTLTSTAGQTPALGATYVATFTSSQPCAWALQYWPSDDAVLTWSADTLTATVTWAIPVDARKTSEYVGVVAYNAGGYDQSVDIVHVGASSVRWIGSGKPYATLAAAITGAPSGTRFVIKNGTYTSTSQFVDSAGGVLPNGVFTTYTDGDGNTRYTVTELTTYMAETPHEVILDGGNTKRPFQILGDHPLEQECFDYDTDAGTSQFQTAPIGAISRVGISIQGFHGINSPEEIGQAINTRFVRFQHCSGVMKNADTFGILFTRSTDVLYEQCFFTGAMRGAFIAFKCLRVARRRNGSTLQNNNGSEPMEMHATYECRHTSEWNCFDIDSKPAWEFKTGSAIVAGSFIHPESDFHNDSYYPDFSQGISAGRLLSVNNYYGSLDGEAWEHDPTAGAYVFADLIAWDNTIYESGHGVIAGGPLALTGATIGRINNQTGDTFFFACFRPPQRVADALFKNMGWNGSAAVDQGYIWNGRNDALPPDSVDNFTLTGTVGTQKNPSFSATFTNQITSTDTAADGFVHLTKIEPGSRFATLGIGVQDYYKIKGKQGAFYVDPGYETEIDRDWTETIDHEKLAALVRAYSHTGPTQTLGTQTLSGNRGWAQASTNLREYLDKYVVNGSTAPTHYPYEFNIRVIAGEIYIFFRNYKNAITDHKIYLNGMHAMTVPAGNHCARVKYLRTGRTYDVALTCRASGVESGRSRLASVTL